MYSYLVVGIYCCYCTVVITEKISFHFISKDDGVPSIIISDRATLSDLSVGDTETKTNDVNRVVSSKVSRITKSLNNFDISSGILAISTKNNMSDWAVAKELIGFWQNLRLN